MVTNRRFCRFNSGASISLGKMDDPLLGMKNIPEGGVCLSAFLVISARKKRQSILMGYLNPSAPWDHIGALDQSRIKVHSQGWMLPSSHLQVHESPQAAAKRIADEQLSKPDLPLSEPLVVSEVYTPKRFPDLPTHWDIEFIFRGELDEDTLSQNDAWKELRFVDIPRTLKSKIARSHGDILESAGIKFAD